MHKEEIVLLHLTLYHIKRLFECAGIANGHFKRYDELGIQPVHIHKSKTDHKEAIMILCKGILEVFRDKTPEELLRNSKIQELLEFCMSRSNAIR
ncbi:MAG TPA: UPF0058 family protein [Archaeoglobus profundus]|nr:UPF0058 family protein [Archaeoglobus profundus]